MSHSFCFPRFVPNETVRKWITVWFRLSYIKVFDYPTPIEIENEESAIETIAQCRSILADLKHGAKLIANDIRAMKQNQVSTLVEDLLANGEKIQFARAYVETFAYENSIDQYLTYLDHLCSDVYASEAELDTIVKDGTIMRNDCTTMKEIFNRLFKIMLVEDSRLSDRW